MIEEVRIWRNQNVRVHVVMNTQGAFRDFDAHIINVDSAGVVCRIDQREMADSTAGESLFPFPLFSSTGQGSTLERSQLCQHSW